MMQYIISRCKSTAGSTDERGHRNSLLKSTVQMCLLQAKVWAYTEHKRIGNNVKTTVVSGF
jgi:hypothetical protein